METQDRLPRSNLTTMLLLAAAFASVLFAQSQNDIDSPWRLAHIVPWWIVAALLFGLLVLYQERRDLLLYPFDGSERKFWQTLLIILAVICSIWAVLLIIDNENNGELDYRDVFGLWLMAIGMIMAANMRRPQISFRQFVNQHRIDLILMAVFTFIAAALRFISLGALPDIVGGDEGLLAIAGLEAIAGAYESPFATVYGAGTLFVHELGALMRIFGANAFGLRAASAIGGTLAVPIVYLLGRELFNRRVAVIAATLLMTSHFHIHFSRMVAVTYIQGTFYASLTIYLLVSGLRRRDSLRLTLAALVLAIYFMIYLDSRVIIGVVLLILMGSALAKRPLFAQNMRRLVLFAFVFLIAAAPMLLWATRHSGEFNARLEQEGTFETGVLEVRGEELQRGALQLIGDSFLSSTMTLVALPVVDFYYNDFPILPTILTGVLFLFGLVYSLTHMRRMSSLILNVWLWGYIAAVSIFTLQWFAGGYRLLTIFPAVCILVGLGLDRILHFMHLPARTVIRVTALVGLLIAIINLNIYFVDYLPSCRFGGDEQTRLSSRIGQYLGRLDNLTRAYLVTDGSVEAGTHPSLEFLSRGIEVINVYDPVNDTSFKVTGPTAFIAVIDRGAELASVANTYPGGEWDNLFDCGEVVFLSYRLDASTAFR